MRKSLPRHGAISAIALAALIACSPQPAATRPAPSAAVEPPSAETLPTKVPPGAVAVPPAPATEPDYAGVWAPASADCTTTTKTYVLGGDMLTLAPQSRSCAVKSMQEEHPTGRSAIYRISATCVSNPPTGAASSGVDLIALTFGASDTVMQMQVNTDKALTLERCPAPPNP